MITLHADFHTRDTAYILPGEWGTAGEKISRYLGGLDERLAQVWLVGRSVSWREKSWRTAVRMVKMGWSGEKQTALARWNSKGFKNVKRMES